MNALKRLIFGRDLREVLDETRIVRVHGVRFVIKKIDPLAHLTGSKVMLQHYDEYKLKKEPSTQISPDLAKHAREHYRDVFLQTVVEPKLCRKPEEKTNETIPVDHLMTDWGLAQGLYLEIMAFTYGKKKLQLDRSLGQNS